MAPDTPIGTRIRRARERLLWTQRQLADALEVDEKTVRNWEADRGYPRNRIGALEQVLGVSLDGEEPSPRPEYDDPDLQRVWELSDGLPEDARRELVRLAGKMRAARRGNGTARPA